MILVVPTVLGILVLVALAVVVKTIRERPKPPPVLDLSDSAYAAALRKWQHDFPKGLDPRHDFPSVADWKAEQVWKYRDTHGVWPGEES